MAPKKQVSPAIRILRGERDASARATHLEAATRKFLVTTNERKYMSTKTNFKRIALVAVAALGLGVLSSVPTQAAVAGLTVTAVDGTASLAKSDSTTAATITIGATMELNDSMTIEVVQISKPAGSANTYKLFFHNLDSTTSTKAADQTLLDTMVVATAAGATAVATAKLAVIPATVVSTNASETAVAITDGAGTNKLRYASLAAATQVVGHKIGLQLDSTTARTAGTYAYRVFIKVFNKGSSNGTGLTAQVTPDQTVTADVNIVVAAAASASTTATGTNNFAFISNTSTSINDGIAARDDSTLAVVATAGSSSVGYIYVGNRNAANASGVAKESLTATVTGVGSVCVSAAATCGTNITVAATGDYQFELRPNGSAGVSTIKITSLVTGATYTKSITYYAKAAKTITAAAYNPVLAIGDNATAIAATAVDAAGVNWGGQAYIVASAAADALIGGSATTPVACSYSAEDLTHFCPVSTLLAGTAKFKIIDASTVALATATSNEVTVTVSNASANTVKLAFNKASYAPYEKAYITVTVLDAAGKTLQGQTFANLFAAGGITSSSAFSSGSDTVTAVSIETAKANSATAPTTAGAKTYTVYMPATGTLTITATGGTSLLAAGRVAVTASATISDSGAAALAAVTALATQVASLRTLITTLTNLVLKIQKKVKA
jgi:trimeric autotransporter adhesin